MSRTTTTGIVAFLLGLAVILCVAGGVSWERDGTGVWLLLASAALGVVTVPFMRRL